MFFIEETVTPQFTVTGGTTSNTDFDVSTTLGFLGIDIVDGTAALPIVISFTVEPDGRLPNGLPLGKAIEAVDQDESPSPTYYMINCAHPTHFASVLERGAPWVERIRCVRANSSALSHAELDNSTELDKGNPSELGEQHRELLETLTKVNILGGCCGTDHHHVDAMLQACRSR